MGKGCWEGEGWQRQEGLRALRLRGNGDRLPQISLTQPPSKGKRGKKLQQMEKWGQAARHSPEDVSLRWLNLRGHRRAGPRNSQEA